MSKKMIWRKKQSVDFDGHDLDEVIAELNLIRSEYIGSVKFESGFYPYEHKEYLFIHVEEEETDEEYRKRSEKEAYWEKQRQQRDLEEYKRLQAKFREKQ